MESVAIVFGDERQADGFFFRKTICGSGTERVEARPGKHDLRQRTRIVYDAKQPELLRIAELMADDCFRLFSGSRRLYPARQKTVISYWHWSRISIWVERDIPLKYPIKYFCRLPRQKVCTGEPVPCCKWLNKMKTVVCPKEKFVTIPIIPYVALCSIAVGSLSRYLICRIW